MEKKHVKMVSIGLIVAGLISIFIRILPPLISLILIVVGIVIFVIKGIKE